MNTVVGAPRVGWNTRRIWWFTATARTKERFTRTALGSFWLGLSNLLSIAVLSFVYGAVFKVKDIDSYVAYLGIGLVVWNTIAAAVQAAPNLFKTNAGISEIQISTPFFTPLGSGLFKYRLSYNHLD
jgi:lipopolysaccharide transport system permease protein